MAEYAQTQFTIDFLGRVEDITAKVKSNLLITDTRTAMQEFLKDYMVTDEKKGEIYANFEATIAANMIKACFDTAMLIPIAQSQIASNDAETSLKATQESLVEEQIKNEKFRGYDIKAGVNLKNWQTIAAWISAKYESVRRAVLIGSDSNNNKINKAREATTFLQAMASRVDPNTDDISYVKEKIDGITETLITDDSAAEVGSMPTIISIV